LLRLVALQASILDSAQRLVKPGGRLVYATCSMLGEENDEQVLAFLERHIDFDRVPITDVWRDVIGTDCPADGTTLSLTPLRHSTDGFFVAVMARKESGDAAKMEDPAIEE